MRVKVINQGVHNIKLKSNTSWKLNTQIIYVSAWSQLSFKSQSAHEGWENENSVNKVNIEIFVYIDVGERANLIAYHTLSGKGQVATFKSGLIAKCFVFNELLLAGDFLGTAVTAR